MDKYGYIGIETLLNFCENSKDHAVTPNDFMRMERVRMPEKKRGKWVNEDTEKMECNCCHHVFDSSSLMNADDEYFWDYPNFCPNCGADMRGEQDYGMIKIKGEGTSLDWQIINSIKDVSVKNIELKNITFECETITDAAGHVFVRQESKEKQNEAD